MGGNETMTEKRFTFHHDIDGIDYIEDETNGFCLVCDKLMCSLLNSLNDENEQLKKENKQMNEQLNSIFSLIDDEMELCKKQYEDAPPEKEKILRERYSLADAIKDIMVKNKKY